jgi:hypothetical protein
MPSHRTGTRAEWRAARLELLDKEKELTRRSDELARQRQELPWVPIDKEYRFETDEGSASLEDLFRFPRMHAAWTFSGLCISGSIGRRKAATRPASGFGATTSTANAASNTRLTGQRVTRDMLRDQIAPEQNW